MEFLHWLSGIRCGFLDVIFMAITALGSEVAFMAIAVAVLWCVSKKDGYYILSVCFIGTVINQFLKLLCKIPRPWIQDTKFKPVESAVSGAEGYSFPSGHTQNAVGAFGSIALFAKKSWLKITCIALCVLIPLSRMYLGVHTPLDVGVSILIAVVLVLAIRPIIYKGEEKPLIMYIFLGVMFILSLSLLLFVELYDFGSELDALNYASGLKNAYTLFGAILGMLAAYPFEKKFVKFDVSGKWYTQILKTAVGLGIVLGIKELLKLPLNAMFPEETVARAIRYAIMVFVAVAVYPLTFKYFKKLEDKIEARRHKEAK
jgi:undecaprenyl-diphosphatase